MNTNPNIQFTSDWTYLAHDVVTPQTGQYVCEPAFRLISSSWDSWPKSEREPAVSAVMGPITAKHAARER